MKNITMNRIAVLTLIALVLLSLPFFNLNADVNASSNVPPCSTPYVKLVNGTMVMEPAPAEDAHWWDITYWADISGNNMPPYMNGEFTAVPNSIVGLDPSDLIWYLPINVAYGTSSSNMVWFQFGLAFAGGTVQMSIWDILANPTTYKYTLVGIPYIVGDTYEFSLTTSGTNTVTFSITDTTTSASWSLSTWHFPIPSTTMLFDWSFFSPSCAIEGYTTNPALTNVPYFPTKVGVQITTSLFRHGINMPTGIASGSNFNSVGYRNWFMYDPSAYKLVTFDQTGVGNDFSGSVLTVDGIFVSSVNDLPSTWLFATNSIHSYSFASPLTVSSNKRYVWKSTSGLMNTQSGVLTVTSAGSIVGNYGTQYYLTVTSQYGTPSPLSGWYDPGTPIIASVLSPVSGPAGTRYVCTGWTGTGSVPASGTGTSVAFTINVPSSITWNWKTQYQLTMGTDYGSISPAAGNYWFDVGSEVTISATPVAIPKGWDGQVNWNGWTGQGTGSYTGKNNPAKITMNGPISETASWGVYMVSLQWDWGQLDRPLTVMAKTNDPSVSKMTVSCWDQSWSNGWIDTVTTKTLSGGLYSFSYANAPNTPGTWWVWVTLYGNDGSVKYCRVFEYVF